MTLEQDPKKEVPLAVPRRTRSGTRKPEDGSHVRFYPITYYLSNIKATDSSHGKVTTVAPEYVKV
jgi:hypothetical protein